MELALRQATELFAAELAEPGTVRPRWSEFEWRMARAAAVLAPGDPGRPRLAGPVDRAAALVGCMVQGAPALPAASPDQLGRGRLRPAPLHPDLTNYR